MSGRCADVQGEIGERDDEIFDKVKTGRDYGGNNCFLQVDDDLAWSRSIGAENKENIAWNTAQKKKAIENHFLGVRGRR